MSELDLFDVAGSNCRFGVNEDGTPYVVASDFAKLMGHRDAEHALRLLDDSEKGTRILGTPGGPQRMSVIYEDGIWELIFRSSLPGARAIKTRVKEILKEIRQTGTYNAAPAIPTHAEALRGWAAEIEAREAAQARLAIAGPKAESWDVLASATGDYSVREAAQILDRDPGIDTGQNRLFVSLSNLGWVDRKGRPYQNHVNAGRISSRVRSYEHPYTGEPTLGKPQVRITIKGLQELHRLLGGERPLQLSIKEAV